MAGLILGSPQDGFPVPSAQIEMRAGVTPPDLEAVVASGVTGGNGANDQGEVTLTGVPAGTYTLKATAPGGGINRETVC